MLKFVLGASFWILLIGLTRIYLGAHYLTDVIGALAAGLLAGLLLGCIRNLALATLLNSTFQLEGRRLNGT
jgi:membrane-associated phospholipid phosphatase